MYYYQKNDRLGIVIEQVIAENPHISFPSGEFPEVLGYTRYQASDAPTAAWNQDAVETSPQLLNGVLTQQWQLIDVDEVVQQQRISAFRNELRARATDVRYQCESAGITVAGIPVATDALSQTKLLSVFVLASQDADYTVQWKGSDGEFYTLNRNVIMSIAAAVRDWVQAAFNWEAGIHAQLREALTWADLSDIQQLIEQKYAEIPR